MIISLEYAMELSRKDYSKLDKHEKADKFYILYRLISDRKIPGVNDAEDNYFMYKFSSDLGFNDPNKATLGELYEMMRQLLFYIGESPPCS